MRHLSSLRHQAQRGFTLLELIVVIAILAIIAGALLVAYDGLESKAAKGQATFDLAAIDKGIRAFKVVTGGYPDKLDNLVDPTGAPLLNINSTLKGKLADFALTADMATALSNVGVATVRSVAAANNTTTGVGRDNQIPNRTHDNSTRGFGADLALADTVHVAVVEADGLTDLLGGANTNSSRLRDISGLDETKQHVVVALGLGNNSTIVSDTTGRNAANFSEAPFYADVKKNEYGRYIALFQVATDTNDNGTIDAGETLTNAKFIGALDTKGDWLDEEYAEFTGQKN